MREKSRTDELTMQEDEHGTYILNSKDMNMLEHIDKLVDAGVIAPVAFYEQVTAMNDAETIAAGTLKNQDGVDTLYAYPETNDNGYYLVYDNTVVSDEQAKTLEGVLEACKTAGKKFIMDVGSGFYGCTFAFTAGALIDGFEEEDGMTQKFVEFDEDEAVKTLMAFAKLIKDYKGTFTALDVANINSGFSSGTCGAGVDGSWNTATNEEALGDKFGAAKLPTINVDGKDKQLISMFGYKYLGVNGSSQFPRTAQILAYYLHGEECQLQRVEKLGWGPSNITVQQNKLVTDSKVLQAIAEQAENAVVQVNIASTFWSPMGNLGSKLVADAWNPDDEAATRKLLQETITNVRDEG